jgi:hypothetical protein
MGRTCNGTNTYIRIYCIYGCYNETATEQSQVRGVSSKTLARERWNIKTVYAVGRKICFYSSYIL